MSSEGVGGRCLIWIQDGADAGFSVFDQECRAGIDADVAIHPQLEKILCFVSWDGDVAAGVARGESQSGFRVRDRAVRSVERLLGSALRQRKRRRGETV
ncbi:MAG TPA: hypothetical protein VK195_15800 [Burkholderiaceae bacterium]|nr:hypothetical protein [Burkholderiaceae bacterium]